MSDQARPPDIAMQRWLNRSALIAGVLAAGIATPILAGWVLDLPFVHQPHVIIMKTNAALALLLCGLGLVLLSSADAGWGRRWVGRLCAAACLVIGALTFSEHLVGWDLGIDQFIAREPPGAAVTVSPNRMGPPASLSLTLLGVALLAMSRRSPRRAGHQYPALAVALLTLLPTVGFLYGANELYGVARYTGIAWPTALALLILSLGVLFARPQVGLMALTTADNAGGILVRRLLLPSLLLPLAVGWLRLLGERYGFYDAPLGTAMVMLILVISFTALTCYCGMRISRAASATRRQKELLGVTLSSIGDAVIATDPEGKITFVNDTAQELTRWPRADALGQPLEAVFRIINEQTRQPVQSPVDEVLHTGRVVSLANHTVLIARDGCQIPIEDSGAPVRAPDGTVHGVVLVFRDFSERKQSDQQTRTALSRFELLAQTASDLLATDSPQAVVERLCRRVLEHLDCQYFFNFLVDDEAGKLHLNACAGIPPEEARRIEWLELGVAVCGCVAQAGQRIIAEDIAANPDPRTDLVRSYGVQAYACHPLLAGGKVIGTLSFGTKTRPAFTPDELSLMKVVADQVATAMERIRLFEQARQQAADLAVANQAKDQFIAALSHELRTPLTPVLMISQILQTDPSLPEHVREEMKTIRQNVVLEARLIDDLLDLTRITRGKLQLKQEVGDVHELLRRAVETCCDEQFAEKQLKLEWDLSASPSEIWADPARIQQVFWNLVRNAIKFTPPGGTITVRTALAGSGRLRVVVQDTGEGIDPGKLNSIFNPFEQGGWDKTRRFGGLGLGLAIAKAIVDLHGGRITAASEGRGKGSTFAVELNVSAPVEEANAPAPDSQITHRPDRNGVPHILLIEDHEPTAKVLQRLMAKWGWKVHWAPNAAAAIEAPSRQIFNLVVSDLGLPDGNGHEVMQQLHARHGLRGIAVSGFGTDEDIQKSLESGFILHLTKPINFEELRSAAIGFLAGATPGSRATA